MSDGYLMKRGRKMKLNRKNITVMTLAGLMSFGIATLALMPVSEAAHHHKEQQESFADGTSNPYSHRMHEEETTHYMNVRAIRYEHRQGELNDHGYDQRLTEEQKRHDKVMQDIKEDYEIHNPHKSK